MQTFASSSPTRVGTGLLGAAVVAVSLACTAAHTVAPQPAPSSSCAGAAPQSLEGAVRVDDVTLRAAALGAPSHGGLCTAATFEAQRPLSVFRVYQRDRAAREPGRWWTFERPTLPRDAFRARYEVCSAWSALDAIERCELRVGVRFAVGPGQSVRCDDGQQLDVSAALQVYVANDARQGVTLVERCEDLGAWP